LTKLKILLKLRRPGKPSGRSALKLRGKSEHPLSQNAEDKKVAANSRLSGNPEKRCEQRRAEPKGKAVRIIPDSSAAMQK